MRKILSVLALAGAITVAVLSGAGSANAATVNPDGSITVSKGDVQTAMHWNDAQFQANASKVVFTGTSNLTGLTADPSTMVQSPVTGDWHDYGYSNVQGINKPEDCQWLGYAFSGDVWSPSKVDVKATPVLNKGEVKGWTLTSTGVVSTTRINHVSCGDPVVGGYDRTTTEYYNLGGGSLASWQVSAPGATATR